MLMANALGIEKEGQNKNHTNLLRAAKTAEGRQQLASHSGKPPGTTSRTYEVSLKVARCRKAPTTLVPLPILIPNAHSRTYGTFDVASTSRGSSIAIRGGIWTMVTALQVLDVDVQLMILDAV